MSTGTPVQPTDRSLGPTTPNKAWAAAVISGLLAFLSSLATALGGAETGFDSITAGQWLTALIAAIVAFASAGGITYVVPNMKKV